MPRLPSPRPAAIPVAAAAIAFACAFSPSFSSAKAAQPVIRPVGVAIVDLNGDGNPDIVTADEQPDAGGVSVLLGGATGQFSTPTLYPSGGSSQGIATGDLNRDGKQDVVVVHADSSKVSVLLGRGDGTLGAPVSYSVGKLPFGVTVADVDGDGVPDVVTGNTDSSDVSLLYGVGDGTLAPASNHTVASGPFDVLVADLDGDGRMDVVTPGFDDDLVSVLLQTSPKQFAKHADYPGGPSPGALAAGDFNGDGIPDLAAAVDGDGGSISIILGLGGGRFAAPKIAPGPVVSLQQVVAADLNGDGKIDVAGADDSGGALVELGHGDGTLSRGIEYRGGVGSAAIAEGDVDHDGHPDLVTAGFASGNVSVLHGHGDGTFDAGVDYTLGAPQPPFVGSPSSVPRTATHGKRFTVTFVVERGDNGLPLTSGKTTFAVTIAGKPLTHTHSFKGGKARTSLVVPRTAKGKALKVKLTVVAGGGAAPSTRSVAYKIR